MITSIAPIERKAPEHSEGLKAKAGNRRFSGANMDYKNA